MASGYPLATFLHDRRAENQSRRMFKRWCARSHFSTILEGSWCPQTTVSEEKRIQFIRKDKEHSKISTCYNCQNCSELWITKFMFLAKILKKYLTAKCSGVISSIGFHGSQNVTVTVFNFWFRIMDLEVFVLYNCIFCPSQYFILFLELHRQNLWLELKILSSDYGPRY